MSIDNLKVGDLLRFNYQGSWPLLVGSDYDLGIVCDVWHDGNNVDGELSSATSIYWHHEAECIVSYEEEINEWMLCGKVEVISGA